MVESSDGQTSEQILGDGSFRFMERVRNATNALAYPVISFGLVLLIWQGVGWLTELPAYILPTPAAVLAVMVERADLLLHHASATALAVVFGFLGAVLLGIPLAVFMVAWRPVEKLLHPPIVGSQAIPKSALAPLFIIWFGYGLLPKILIAVLIAFFPVVEATVVGLRVASPRMIDLGRSMGMSQLALYKKIRAPAALPSVFGGLKVGIALAVVGVIVGEFVGSDRGIGYLLIVSVGQFNTTLLFAGLITLAALGIAMFTLISWAERISIPWYVDQQRHTRKSSWMPSA